LHGLTDSWSGWARDMRRPLQVGAFRHVAGAFTINELGNWLGEIALAVIVFDRTHNPLLTAALFLCARFVPALVAPAFTARLEHLRGTRVLPALHLGEALVFAALALCASAGSTALLIGLAAVDGVLAIAARAMLWATSASLLGPRQLLRQGNSILNGGFTVAGALGPVLAGALVATVGIVPALSLDAVSFLAAALILARAPSLPLGGDNEEHVGWRRQLGEGLRYAIGHRRVRELLVWQTVTLVLFTLVVPIEIVFVKAQLHAGDAGYGALLGSWGAGMIAGAAVFTVAHGISVGKLLVVSSLAIALAYLGIAASPTLLGACLASLLGGLGNGVGWVALLTALQAATPPERQVVVMALFESLSTVMPGLGFALGGGIAAIATPRVAYAAAGFGVLGLLVLALANAARHRARGPVPTRAQPIEMVSR
jgi:MFS family permease